ncbi:MAG: hypothetical protein PHR11_05205 [Candidatus Omnitrophica bacterium]|nr:hypothetical protein [Candidatus Omnitrophota bacterium]
MKPGIAFIAFISLLSPPPCFAAPGPETYKPLNVLVSKEQAVNHGETFVIRQEMFKRGTVLVSGPNRADGMIADMFRAEGIGTLGGYLQWLKKNVRYRPDDFEDDWALPEEVLERKYGDCEDYSFFNAAVLGVLGYRPKVLGLWGIRISPAGPIGNHAICAFQKEGRYAYLDNERLWETGASSMEEFRRYIAKHYACRSVSEISLDNKSKKTALSGN